MAIFNLNIPGSIKSYTGITIDTYLGLQILLLFRGSWRRELEAGEKLARISNNDHKNYILIIICKL